MDINLFKRSYAFALSVLFISCSFPAFSQDAYHNEKMISHDTGTPIQHEQKLIEESTVYLLEELYEEAEPLVNELLSIKPESCNYNYRKGLIELYEKKNHTSALAYFQRASTNTDINYDMFSVKELSAPTDAFYHLAVCHHFLEEIEKAESNYSNFLENSIRRSELVNEAKVRLDQCNVAKELLASPIDMNVEMLGVVINTKAPEYSPVVSPNGKELYFTSRRTWDETSPFEGEDIYVSKKLSDGWSRANRMEMCIEQQNEACLSFTANMDALFLYNDSTGNGDIYSANYQNKNYATRKFIDIKGVNSKYWETHYFMAADEKSVYFSSDRPGGYGGRDIYVIRLNEEGTWSSPENLGPSINSAMDEDAPFLTLDGKELYFASNGSKSMGGFDIFKAELNSDNEWSESINMGYPFNSTGDDIFFTMTADGSKGYLSSFRQSGEGEKDIFEVSNNSNIHAPDVVRLYGGVRYLANATSEVSITARLVEEGQSEHQDLIVRDGEFFSLLDHCKSYTLEIYDEEKNELLHSAELSTNCDQKGAEFNEYAYVGSYLLAGTIFDEQSGKALSDVTVEFFNPSNEELLETHSTDEIGKYTSGLLTNKKFGQEVSSLIIVSKTGYYDTLIHFDTTLAENGIINVNVDLKKMSVQDYLAQQISNEKIYFDFDEHSIRDNDRATLDKIVDIMNEYETVQIRLEAYTDCRGPEWYNVMLSEKRAKSSIRYIRERISNPERITGVGMGEANPVNSCDCSVELNSNCDEDAYLKNRRTIFRIVED